MGRGGRSISGESSHCQSHGGSVDRNTATLPRPSRRPMSEAISLRLLKKKRCHSVAGRGSLGRSSERARHARMPLFASILSPSGDSAFYLDLYGINKLLALFRLQEAGYLL